MDTRKNQCKPMKGKMLIINLKVPRPKTQWDTKNIKVHIVNQGCAERVYLKEKKSCEECKGNNK